DEETHQELGYERIDIDRYGGVEQRGGEEQLRYGQAQMEEPDREPRRRNDEEGVQDVVAGDGPRALARIRSHLDERVQGNDVKASEDTDEREVGEDAPVGGLAHEL